MKKAGVEPDVYTFNALITLFARCGDLEQAQTFFDSLQSKELVANEATYASLILACSRQNPKEWQLALSYLELLRTTCPLPLKSNVAFNNAILCCGLAGRPREALAVLSQLRERNDLPDADLVSYNCCLRALDAHEGLEILELMDGEGIEPDWASYSNIFTRLEKEPSSKEDVLAISDRVYDHAYNRGHTHRLWSLDDLLLINLSNTHNPVLAAACVRHSLRQIQTSVVISEVERDIVILLPTAEVTPKRRQAVINFITDSLQLPEFGLAAIVQEDESSMTLDMLDVQLWLTATAEPTKTASVWDKVMSWFK